MNGSFTQILLSQLVAYCLANFIIVPSHYLSSNKRFVKPRWLWSALKGMIFLIFSALLTWVYFLAGSCIIACVVFASSFYFDKKDISNKAFLISQLLQLIAILIIIPFFLSWENYAWFFRAVQRVSADPAAMWVVLAFLLCLGPANVIIKFLLKSYDLIPPSDKGESLIRAGRFIGNIERVITLVLVLSNQFAAIGLFMAAKSVLRLKENDFRTSEYVLVGTLLSFGIAIVLGILTVQITP